MTGSTWAGVFPAVNMPMDLDGTPSQQAFRRHVSWLASFDVAGLTINGHAGELESLTPFERAAAISWARDAAGPDLRLIAGVTGMSTREVVECAVEAEMAGASALLVCPLPHFSFGAVDDPGLVVPYFAAIAEAVSIPLVIFRYHEQSGLRYSVPVLVEIARQVEQVVGIKDSSFDYEAAWTEFQYFDRKVALLVAQGSLFLSRFRTADGAISSFANVAPEYLVEMFRLCQAGELDQAREAFGRVRGLSRAIYGMVPLMQHWAVEKEALHARGRFPTSVCRPPFQPLSPADVAAVRQAVAEAGLAEAGLAEEVTVDA
ncbi:dihydrodipicolinate synthase family protein [Phytohabitans kaempferiae]|uniref:Dihydrodipicolinate synthase family protein n=1 Tax=Phytohabitans kaempferiae TaxID=1620943 RepID=A0ABV6LZF2_9ACTN